MRRCFLSFVSLFSMSSLALDGASPRAVSSALLLKSVVLNLKDGSVYSGKKNISGNVNYGPKGVPWYGGEKWCHLSFFKNIDQLPEQAFRESGNNLELYEVTFQSVLLTAGELEQAAVLRGKTKIQGNDFEVSVVCRSGRTGEKYLWPEFVRDNESVLVLK